ncbi:MAG: FtsX-like permease family protein [Acidimicrobiales bacterium]
MVESIRLRARAREPGRRAVSAAYELWSARFSTSLRRWIILGLIIGVGVTAGATSLVAARSTATAFDRIRELAQMEAVSVSHNRHPDVAEAELGKIEGVDALYHRVGLVYEVAGTPPGAIQASLAIWDGDEYPGGLIVLDGRLPDPSSPTEVMISQGAVERTGLGVGDQLDLTHIGLGDVAAGEEMFVFTPETGLVVGVVALPRELFDDEAARFGSIVHSPARARQQVETAFWSETGVVVDDPKAIAEVERRVRQLGWDLNQDATVDKAVAHDSARPLVVVLYVLAGLVFVATALVGSQALLRVLDSYTTDVRTLEAVGLQRRDFALLDGATGLFVALVAALVAALGTIVGSLVGSLGWAADVDPRTGIHVDWPVLIGVVLGIVAVAMVVSVTAGLNRTSDRTRSRPATVPTWVPGRAVPQATAAFMAGDDRRRLVGGVLLGGVGVSVLIAVAVFLSSLQGLVDEPARYGHHGDLVVRDQYGDIEPAELNRRFGGDPAVLEVTGFGQTSFLVNGSAAVPGVTVFNVKGEPSVSLSRGRLPLQSGEALLGGATMEQLGVELGDSISIQRVPGPDDQFESDFVPSAVDVVVVGSVVIAPISMGPGPQAARLDEGIWVNATVLRDGGDHPDAPEWAILRLDEADPASLASAHPPGDPGDLLAQWPASIEWFEGAEPTEVSQAESAIPLLLGTAFVSVLAVAVLIAQGRLSHIRQNRAAYGLLDAVGFTRRQVASTVAWQAVIVSVATLLIGLPLGLVGGRLWWSSFSDQLGVLGTSDIDPTLVLVISFLVVAAATAVSLIPAVWVGRTSTASVLGQERT